MSAYQWLLESVVLAIHDEQIAEHGGVVGIRDKALLESALARPLNIAVYESHDIAKLAASYAVGLAKNHPFADGNKRTAFVVMELFLILNGYELQANDVDCVVLMLQVAAGEMNDEALAVWIRENSKRCS